MVIYVDEDLSDFRHFTIILPDIYILQKQTRYFSKVLLLQLHDYPYYANFINAVM